MLLTSMLMVHDWYISFTRHKSHCTICWQKQLHVYKGQKSRTFHGNGFAVWISRSFKDIWSPNQMMDVDWPKNVSLKQLSWWWVWCVKSVRKQWTVAKILPTNHWPIMWQLPNWYPRIDLKYTHTHIYIMHHFQKMARLKIMHNV